MAGAHFFVEKAPRSSCSYNLQRTIAMLGCLEGIPFEDWIWIDNRQARLAQSRVSIGPICMRKFSILKVALTSKGISNWKSHVKGPSKTGDFPDVCCPETSISLSTSTLDILRLPEDKWTLPSEELQLGFARID